MTKDNAVTIETADTSTLPSPPPYLLYDEEGSAHDNISEAASEEERATVDQPTPPKPDDTPPKLDDTSFKSLFPLFDVNRKPAPKKPCARQVFLATYADFKSYMVKTKLQDMPPLRHIRSSARIYLDKDGTSSNV
jgi:hypothetical protein